MRTITDQIFRWVVGAALALVLFVTIVSRPPPIGDVKFFYATFSGLHFESRTCSATALDGKVISTVVEKSGSGK